eukprot:112303_1
MALPMMTAVEAFCKRVLQPTNFDWSAGNIIHDNLNSFCEYTLACYGFVHELQQKQPHAMPFQLDFRIIPQLPGLNSMGTCDEAKEETIHPIDDLGHHLKQSRYVKGRDFLCEGAHDTIAKVQKQLYKMWETLSAGQDKYKRYALVIDRSNPSTDRIYVIIPKRAHNASREVRSIQDLCVAYSKQYLLPHNGRARGINDALNGYKFVLSFHILDHNTLKVHFYNNNGGHKFELIDVNGCGHDFLINLVGVFKQIVSQNRLNRNYVIKIENY